MITEKRERAILRAVLKLVEDNYYVNEEMNGNQLVQSAKDRLPLASGPL